MGKMFWDACLLGEKYMEALASGTGLFEEKYDKDRYKCERMHILWRQRVRAGVR